jgi:hypothetical protein
MLGTIMVFAVALAWLLFFMWMGATPQAIVVVVRVWHYEAFLFLVALSALVRTIVVIARGRDQRLAAQEREAA